MAGFGRWRCNRRRRSMLLVTLFCLLLACCCSSASARLLRDPQAHHSPESRMLDDSSKESVRIGDGTAAARFLFEYFTMDYAFERPDPHPDPKPPLVPIHLTHKPPAP